VSDEGTQSSAKEFFDELPGHVDPSEIAGIDHSYLFVITGAGRWLVELRDGTVQVTEGFDGDDDDADATISASHEVFERLVAGSQNPMMAYMTGKLKVSGDINAALKLQKLF
jgi:alkyl sulfatase BDS1-like metallo-beta-lactamase superfamily hydrolase